MKMENIRSIFDFIVYQETIKLLEESEYLKAMEELGKLGGKEK